MKCVWLVLFISACCGSWAQDRTLTLPTDRGRMVFQEQDGILAFEAEDFFEQERDDIRAWYRVTPEHIPNVKPDPDKPIFEGVSGGAHIECLPDTRRTHGDKLINGENFSNAPGKLAILSYRVRITNPGRYRVWARARSTGTEDNGFHIGLNGTWPESGQRWQTVVKQRWHWESKQRTSKAHTGVPGKLFLDVEKGDHVLHISMREDGTELDRIVLAKDFDWHPEKLKAASPAAKAEASKQTPRGENGDGTVTISGEKKAWHKVTLTLDGPWAHELDTTPNPFTDIRMRVVFRHESGDLQVVVPGYFAADGTAGETSSESGTAWRAHLSPDRPGRWDWQVSFKQGKNVALSKNPKAGEPWPGYSEQTGSFIINPTDKTGRDFRGEGRLQLVGNRYQRFAESGRYFLKAGADAPETLLAYKDFDGTEARNPRKGPLKSWSPHLQDWRAGDPVWKGGKGKGLIGALNYLSGKGANAFSFLTYNAGGDGDNVWPFAGYDNRFHYDCSKLDQWGIVFDHATCKGLHLHFKLQETENDDKVPASLDGGELGLERRLYLREMIARYGHNLALNWNLGEENTQTTAQQNAMLDWIARLDPYGHNRVLHTYPNQQDKVYNALIGDQSKLTGLSIQNSYVGDCHWQTVKWVKAAKAAGKPWIVAFDEPGNAQFGMPSDPGYGKGYPKGYDGPTIAQTRKQALWGTLMGGGVGVEYYFGYKLPENDLVCEDWRSRDRSWEYCRVALDFFREHEIPFWEMEPADHLVGKSGKQNAVYCLAKPGEVYVIYLAEGGQARLDLNKAPGTFKRLWFNPRTGESMPMEGQVEGQNVDLASPGKKGEDWVAKLWKEAK